MEFGYGPPYFTPQTPPPPICTRIGKYVIHSSLIPKPSNYSYIYLCSDTEDHKKKVIKFIKLFEDKKDRIKSEIDVMRSCNHPNIIKIQDYFRYESYVCIILPYTPHRSVLSFLEHNYDGGMHEDIARVIMSQMLQAVNYLHEMSIWHRDIKPDNFLVFLSPRKSTNNNNDNDDDNDENNIADEENDLYCVDFDLDSIHVVLSDFGFAEFFIPGQKSSEFLGTFEYMAPEILNEQPYDCSVDVWALGITLFRLLTNDSPYPSTSSTYTFFMNKAKKGELNMRKLDYNNVSIDAINLIQNMCKFNPNERIKASQARTHVWIKSLYSKSPTESEVASAIGISYSYQFNPSS